ncbi:MAG: DUF3253 domain-containing protein [Alphaproteobacteria bacterium]
MNIEAITDAMLRIAAERGPEKSLCPTDVARAVSAENWRPLLGAVRKVAADLARQGKIEILRKGKPINPDDMRGVIRLRATSGNLPCFLAALRAFPPPRRLISRLCNCRLRQIPAC